MFSKKLTTAAAIFAVSLSCTLPKPPSDEEILASNKPVGTISPQIGGYEIFGDYGLHDDFLKFRASARPDRGGWGIVRTEWQADFGPAHNFNDCVRPLWNTITDCEWENPRDGLDHKIIFKAYFARIKAKYDENNNVVRLNDGQIAMDTLIHKVPATHTLTVHCFKR